MSRIDDIVKTLKTIGSDPKKAADDSKKAGFKGAVGVMPVYAPEEIVYAAGYLPVGMWGAQKKAISKARAELPPFASSIAQSIMELELEGYYDNLDAVLFSVPSDTLKCMSDKWHGKAPIVVFTHPQNRKIDAAVPFLVEEYRLLQYKLEHILNVKITDEAIQKAIEVYNANRQALREFSDLAAEHLDLVDPAARHAVIRARWYMDKAKHTALVAELNGELKKAPASKFTGKRVVLTGLQAEPDEVLDIFKEFGFGVVADDLADEDRQYRIDVPAGNDALTRLAKWWQDFDGCSFATDPLKPRGQIIIDRVKKYKADAIIVCMMKFCDPEEWDYPILVKEFDDAGVKNIMIEIDQEATSFEQVKTRVQTFAEIL
ncbi:r-phenyllactate dehydratase small subunit [Alphaproteobacteria bacterium]|nr:r-phenyllactate dehydratase small subunit [Alphaproteobacteria bacterium]